MKLSLDVLDTLAEMICGASGGWGGFNWEGFPYRSSSYLSGFFYKCNLPYEHDGNTRKSWVHRVLLEINDFFAANPALPPAEMVRVIEHLVDPVEFQRQGLDHQAALAKVNVVLAKDGCVCDSTKGSFCSRI